MCGIAGVFHASGATPDRGVLQALGDAMAHRGPDQEGFLCQPGVGLVSRRLRIIDLEGGAQPICNEDGSVVVVFNGEIYNFESLREDLRRAGHTFSTEADTEVIVHLYEDLGDQFVTCLRGMFAIALWDQCRRRGVLVRDRAGKKPVVYSTNAGSLYFASELQSLLLAPGLERRVNLGAVGDYLAYGYVPAPTTIYQQVHKLLPGHRLIWEDGAVRTERYWSLEYQPKLEITENEALEVLEEKVSEAVRLRLIADVPLGALLSGGVDSSTVVALMARHSATPVKTFSIGFEEAAYDELPHARRVAERYGTDHHELVVKPDAAAILPALVRHYGEPYADSSAVPTFYVSQLARRHVTVALNGDGGDEDLAGYDRYQAMRLAHQLRAVPAGRLVFPTLGRVVARLPGVPTSVRRGTRFLGAMGLPPGERYAHWVGTTNAKIRGQLLEPEAGYQMELARSRAVEAAFDQRAGLNLVDRLLSTDVSTYLPNDLLVKMDIASMANSLETRSPLLDHEVMEFTAALPVGLKLHGRSEQKYLLKKLAAKLIPAENIDRPKMGFGVPIATWLRGPLRELAQDALLSEQAQARGYFRPEAVRRLWNGHQNGTRDYSSTLWTLLMLELWQREFMDDSLAVRTLQAV